jgi:hypothetical protein
MDELIVSKVKPPYSSTPMSQEELIEFKKCKNDPEYFMKNYCYVNKAGKTKYQVYDYVHDLIDVIHKNQNSCIMCARQLGKCVIGDTIITINDVYDKISNVFRLSFKQKVVNYLERLLIKLSR